MSNKNQQSSGPFYAVILLSLVFLLLAIYNTFVASDTYGELDYFSGYYEADPYFLDLSNLKNMSILIKKEDEKCGYSGRLMWVDGDEYDGDGMENDVEEIDISLDIKKINNISLYKKECFICIQSDVDHPLTNCDIRCIVNIKSGEIGMYDIEKSVLLASFIKDNAISLYVNK
jgi:hypothetical protein